MQVRKVCRALEVQETEAIVPILLSLLHSPGGEPAVVSYIASFPHRQEALLHLQNLGLEKVLTEIAGWTMMTPEFDVYWATSKVQTCEQ